MTTHTDITRTQAEAVRTAVAEQFRSYWQGFTIPADEDGPERVYPDTQGPVLVEHYESWGGSDIRWAIVWEEGPFEWAMNASMGGYDDEVAEALLACGKDRTYAEQQATVEAVTTPDGVFVEPVNGYVLGVYPA